MSLISLSHRTTKLPFSLAQEQNLLAPGNQTCFLFFCPADLAELLLTLQSALHRCKSSTDGTQWK